MRKKIAEFEGDSTSMDETFKNKFTLYPEESIQGVIGIYGENMENTFLSPMIYIDLVYKKGNDKKLEKYSLLLFKK